MGDDVSADPDLGIAVPLFREFCFECHSGPRPKARLDLSEVVTKRRLEENLDVWERIVEKLEEGEMPPEDEAQPREADRDAVVAAIRSALDDATRTRLGDPGRVVLRRLTSAEYTYTLHDLTGIDFDFSDDLPEDAAGGEGFANVGSVQFLDSAMLERYIELAHRVASHALIGAGPLAFFEHPGETGLELSAVERIQSIYREHGFRATAGEQANPFGLDLYSHTFRVAWRFRHREALGLADATLADLARAEGISARFAAHVVSVLNEAEPPPPVDEIVEAWNEFPDPESLSREDLEQEIRDDSEALLGKLLPVQRRLAKRSRNPDEAAVLTRASSDVARALLERFPDSSQGEPAPSDRDPIPSVFDNAYNTPERNLFHARLKYYRKDDFLVAHILDDETRSRLEIAWDDLYGSFDYHDLLLRFVAEKHGIPLGDRGMETLDASWIAALSDELRPAVETWRSEYRSMRRAFARAEPGHVEDVVDFASRAWRRALDPEEAGRLRALYRDLRSGKRLDHPAAIRTLIARVLASPSFLFRIERSVCESETVVLDAYEIASRLSYFLWSSLPDRELRRAAEDGELDSPDGIAREARRMLQDPKVRRLAVEFFGQWFGFYRFDRYRGVDAERFPEFAGTLRSPMYEEAVTFFDHIVRGDRPVDEILFADYVFVDSTLAEHYGIDRRVLDAASPVEGSEAGFVRVDDAGAVHRGGLLGLGAVLTVTSAPLRTSPVRRGDWILRRVLGKPVPPPPPDAGSIPADDVAGDGKSVRERLEEHRRDPSCARCHSRMDPLGFALERFGPTGGWREAYRDGRSIDDSSTLRDGAEVGGFAGLLNALAERRDDVYRQLCEQLLGYALGRSILTSDRGLIGEMVAEIDENGGHFSALVAKIVASPQFRFRRGAGGDRSPTIELNRSETEAGRDGPTNDERP